MALWRDQTEVPHKHKVARPTDNPKSAEQVALEGKRKNGRWERGSVIGTSQLSDGAAWIDAMHKAGLVLDYAPELADQVIGGEATLNEAATAAEQKRTEADRRAEARRQPKERKGFKMRASSQRSDEYSTNRPIRVSRVARWHR